MLKSVSGKARTEILPATNLVEALVPDAGMKFLQILEAACCKLAVLLDQAVIQHRNRLRELDERGGEERGIQFRYFNLVV